MKELTNWEIWQIQKYGNILPVPDMEIEEPGIDEADRFAEWMTLNAERNLSEYE